MSGPKASILKSTVGGLVVGVLSVWRLLERRDRWQVLGLSVVMVVAAIGQAITISLIAPFLGLAFNPRYVETKATLAQIYALSGAGSVRDFVLVVGVVLVLAIVLTNLAALVVMAGSAHFGWMLNRHLSHRLLSLYMRQPYSFFANRSACNFTQRVLIDIQNMVSGTVMPALELFSRVLTVVFIISLLLLVDARTTMIAGTVFGASYLLLFSGMQRRLRDVGRSLLQAQTQRFRTTMDAFGSIKETRILQRESEFLAAYDGATAVYARGHSLQTILGQSPRLLIEILAFGGIVALVLVLFSRGQDMGLLIPTLTLFTLAAYRLIPALQQIFASLAQLQSNEAVVQQLTRDLRLQPDPMFAAGLAPLAKLPFSTALELRAVTFRYPERERPALAGITVAIRRGEMVAFCGATGSGKTTLVDLLMGLHSPTEGELCVDGLPVNGHGLRQWQVNFGYVPQAIFLLDSSVSENVAFGLAAEQIDQARVEAACRMARIHDFIEHELPGGYASVVGDRGVKLSGGQRQRIGLARALYLDPAILVLDEATSALDNETERHVMEAIQEVAKTRTVIIIAHRLSTVQRCDRIYFLEQGRVAGAGTFDELMKDCPAYARMVQGGELGPELQQHA